jgi:hypothetical protein
MRDTNGNKYFLVSQLSKLLATLPPDCKIMPNQVGNLSVYFPDGGFSYIDFIMDDIDYAMEPPVFL